jgi:hypothetical protein
MTFDLCIGIDYSGAGTAESRSASLQVYACCGDEEPVVVRSPASREGSPRNWSRREIANWLIEQTNRDVRLIAGIDHGFSFPFSYFQRYQLTSWPEFLSDFSRHWPTDQEQVSVEQIRRSGPGASRTGSNDEWRLTERWTSSAKSVFHFDVQGSVAKSTHAGIPWLRRLRAACGPRLHFWPFDGWNVPPDTSMIAEVYPSIFRNRYPRDERSCDQQDAYCVARWLADVTRDGFCERYLEPPLTDESRRIASLEGWILGIA